MEITKEMGQEIVDHVLQHYFGTTKIEQQVLSFLCENSLRGQTSTTQSVCQYLEQLGVATSPGAVRGTILRIRHKLLKYQSQSNQHAYHLIFPEHPSHKGYLLQFEKNLNYRHTTDLTSDDPWLAMNWKALRTQGYRGLWRGFSLPDGGRWPVKLYVFLNSVRDEAQDQEIFMCLLNSPSSTKHRIGILEGKVKDHILCLEGKWSVHYQDEGLKYFQLTARLWPFRTSQSDPVKISGRFTLYNEELQEYQEGQIEIDYCATQAWKAKDFEIG